MKNLNDLMPMIGSRFYTQLDTQQMQRESVQNELGKELQNGTRRGRFNFTPILVNSISFGSPHVRTMGRTCGA